MLIAGVDEVGRGPLAGAVVVAAVILDPARPIDGLADSKTLTEQRREQLAAHIRRDALHWHVAQADVAEIDRLNILRATLLAMRRAVLGLARQPRRVLVDGNRCPDLPMPCEPIVKGDASRPCIAAASILAKVARDRMMRALHQAHPVYGFDRHKGYPTKDHLAALERYGPIGQHRRSFRPVAACLPVTHGVRVL